MIYKTIHADTRMRPVGVNLANISSPSSLQLLRIQKVNSDPPQKNKQKEKKRKEKKTTTKRGSCPARIPSKLSTSRITGLKPSCRLQSENWIGREVDMSDYFFFFLFSFFFFLDLSHKTYGFFLAIIIPGRADFYTPCFKVYLYESHDS